MTTIPSRQVSATMFLVALLPVVLVEYGSISVEQAILVYAVMIITMLISIDSRLRIATKTNGGDV